MAPSKKIQPSAETAVKIQGPRMERRRPAGSTCLGKIMRIHTSSRSLPTTRKRMVMTRASRGKHHPVKERSRGELEMPR